MATLGIENYLANDIDFIDKVNVCCCWCFIFVTIQFTTPFSIHVQSFIIEMKVILKFFAGFVIRNK